MGFSSPCCDCLANIMARCLGTSGGFDQSPQKGPENSFVSILSTLTVKRKPSLFIHFHWFFTDLSQGNAGILSQQKMAGESTLKICAATLPRGSCRKVSEVINKFLTFFDVRFCRTVPNGGFRCGWFGVLGAQDFGPRDRALSPLRHLGKWPKRGRDVSPQSTCRAEPNPGPRKPQLRNVQIRNLAVLETYWPAARLGKLTEGLLGSSGGFDQSPQTGPEN